MRLQNVLVYGDPRHLFTRWIMRFQRRQFPLSEWKLTHTGHLFIPETDEECQLPFAGKVFEAVSPRVRATDIGEWFRDKTKWHIYEYKGSQKKVLAFGWWSRGTEGRTEYDWAGVFAFPLRIFQQDKYKNFCSEYEVEGMIDTRIFPPMDSHRPPAWLDAYLSGSDEWETSVRPA